MKNHLVKSFWYIFISLLLTSCLQEKAAVTSSSGQSWFEGVVSAKNTGGASPSIVVSWNAANVPVRGYKVYTLVYDPFTKTNKMENVFSIDSDTLTYSHSQNVVAGAIYTFMVHAINEAEEEDTNTKQISTMAFAGIDKVEITGTTTATITLESGTGAFDEVRVYAQPERAGGAKIKVATETGSVRLIYVTGLQSGVKYKFFVNAYMSYLNSEDGNTHSVIGQTWSSSFGSGVNPTNPDDQSGYQYRGILAVQALGESPHSTLTSTQRLARLTWLPFYGATAQTTYRVIRTQVGNTVDTTTGIACSESMNDSCIVACPNTGAGTQTCTDYLVSAPPKTYNYVVALVKTENGGTWVEELPITNASDFYTKVAIPPANMVLVQRDAANYEMCQMMSANPNPRKHQRCVYTGMAGKPYNNGPGKPPRTDLDEGFYDFGYNLLIDRTSMGCNWTRVSPSCGANGCIGITSATTAAVVPSAALGVDGNVFFALNGGYGENCFYKKGGNWLPVGNISSALTQEEMNFATTLDPKTDYRTPAMSGVSQASAFNICNSKETEYGNKRLMRRRELVQATAFPTLPGEPNAILDKVQLQYLRVGSYNSTALTGGQLPGYRRCASGSESSRLIIPTTLLELLNPLNFRSQINIGVTPVLNYMSRPYFIGTVATSNCLSRWGGQDPVANNQMDGANAVLADTFTRTTTDPAAVPAMFAPIDSDYDSGVVKDWSQGVSFTYQFNNVSGPALGDAGNWYWDYEMNQANALVNQSFVLAMGMPLIAATTTPPYTAYKNTSSLVFNGVLGANIYGAGSNLVNRVVYKNTTSTIASPRFVLIQGSQHRFSYTLHPEQHTPRFGVWCALEAE